VGASLAELQPGKIYVGSLVQMSDLAAHAVVRQQIPMVGQALELSVSAQLRNMASSAGICCNARGACISATSLPRARGEPPVPAAGRAH
jgi:CO/xanthine dehydrogenase FAD-binding subunit